MGERGDQLGELGADPLDRGDLCWAGCKDRLRRAESLKQKSTEAGANTGHTGETDVVTEFSGRHSSKCSRREHLSRCSGLAAIRQTRLNRKAIKQSCVWPVDAGASV